MKTASTFLSFEVYVHIVEALIHSSHDAALQLQRDGGDSQMFEQILLNDDEDSKLKLKYLTLLGFDQDASLDTLHP